MAAAAHHTLLPAYTREELYVADDSVPPDPRGPVLRLTVFNARVRELPMSSILRTLCLQRLDPFLRAGLVWPVRVLWLNGRSNAQLFRNIHRVTVGLQHPPAGMPYPTSSDCSCRCRFVHRRFWHRSKDTGAVLAPHVLTVDVNVVPHAGLRALLDLGPLYVPASGSDMEFLTHVRDAADELFTASLQANVALSVAHFLEWRVALLALVHAALSAPDLQAVPVDTVPLRSPGFAAACRHLDRHYGVTFLDKPSRKRFVFVCRAYARFLLLGFLTSSSYYSRLHVDWNTMSAVQRLAVRHYTGFVHPLLVGIAPPILYILIKEHKILRPPRGILSTIDCPIRTADDTLCILLTLVYVRLERHYRGHPAWWAFRSLVELVQWLPRYAMVMIGTDIRNMYNELAHPDIFASVSHCVREAFGLEPGAHIRVTSHAHRRAEWSHREYDAQNSAHYDLDKLLVLLVFVVSNTLAMWGEDGLYRQVRGLPMGGASSVVIACLFCWFYEHRFYQRLRPDLRHFMARFCRFLDDVLSFDVPEFFIDLVRTSMYPTSIDMTITNSGSPQHVEFFGLEISIVYGVVHTRRFDRAQALGVRTHPLGLASSCVAPTQPFSVGYGRLITLYRSCSAWEHFLDQAVTMLRTAIHRDGHSRLFVISVLRRFISHVSSPVHWRYRCYIRPYDLLNEILLRL
jgi:hypothetical protein